MQLHQKIKTKFRTMRYSTVYKTLDLLMDLNLVIEVDLHDDSHYDGKNMEPHPHHICVNCNRIKEGVLELDPLLLQKLEEKSGFHTIRSQISFFVYCPDRRDVKHQED